MDEKRLIKTFLELLKINGPPLKEKPVADYLRKELGDLGLEVKEDGAARALGGNCGNLLVGMPGGNPQAPGLIFSAHLDTIFPTDKLRVIEEKGIFYSDGSTILGADNRAGVAVILELARVMVESGGSPVPLEFLFTVAEEKGLLGVKALRKGWLQGKFAFTLDAGGPIGTVVNQAPFGQKIKVTIKGKAAHAGMEPETGISAIVIAGQAISRMKLGRIDDQTTANIGKIKGGEAQNVVPEKAEVTGEARSLNEESLLRQVEQMERCFTAASGESGGQIEFQSDREYPGFHLPEGSVPVEIVRRAAARLGFTFRLEASGGASDANFINGLGIPTLNLSVGYKKPHTREENISRKDLLNAAELAYEIVRQASII